MYYSGYAILKLAVKDNTFNWYGAEVPLLRSAQFILVNENALNNFAKYESLH